MEKPCALDRAVSPLVIRGKEEPKRRAAHSPGTREQIYVTAGQLVVEAAGNQATPTSGTCCFSALTVRYRYQNSRTRACALHLADAVSRDRKADARTGMVKL